MNAARLTVLLLASAVSALAADVAPVIAPTVRTTALERARQLLAAKDATPPATLKDPFYSEAFLNSAASAAPAPGSALDSAPNSAVRTAAPAARPAGPRSGRDLLETLATGLKPSGFLVLRGEPVLLFGQKRVKAGDALTITFEGAEYPLVITAIKAPNFTVRLNNDEFTRPIK
jgi:hypothetical protein